LSWLLCSPDSDSDVFSSYLWLGFWHLVSIDWLCDLPVWLIGLGTYVINLLLFINKPVGQRFFFIFSRAFAPASLRKIFNFHSELGDNRWASIWMNGEHIDAMLSAWQIVNWAEPSTVDLSWSINASFPVNKPHWWDLSRPQLIYSVFHVKCKEINIWLISPKNGVVTHLPHTITDQSNNQIVFNTLA